jgi:uncharacterized NAD-dependent epimerase/dehydratase family protein
VKLRYHFLTPFANQPHARAVASLYERHYARQQRVAKHRERVVSIALRFHRSRETGTSVKPRAILLGDELLRTPYGKTAHGLLRRSDRFDIVAVVGTNAEPGDAGQLIGMPALGIPLVSSVAEALATARTAPQWAIVGIATPGGTISPQLRALALSAAQSSLSLVNGLHDQLADDAEIAAEVARHGKEMIDLRRIKKPSEMQHWTGRICDIAATRVAVLGTDCIVGKRTTAWMIVSALRQRSCAAEFIYTGQTGWLQGADYGFVLDATVNDFITGELEAALLACERDKSPDVMVIEGQSSMQNPSTPCGAEIIVSGDVQGVVLQHTPGRKRFCGCDTLEGRRPSLDTEIALLAAYKVPLLGICLNFSDFDGPSRDEHISELNAKYAVPVTDPLRGSLNDIIINVERMIERRENCRYPQRKR